MTEYIEAEYRVVLSVHEDDVPTPGEVGDALWDELDQLHDYDSIFVERIEKESGGTDAG